MAGEPRRYWDLPVLEESWTPLRTHGWQRALRRLRLYGDRSLHRRWAGRGRCHYYRSRVNCYCGGHAPVPGTAPVGVP